MEKGISVNRKLDIPTKKNKSILTLFTFALGIMTTMVKLDVPLFRQPHVDYCVPACIKMVLEYLRNIHGDKVPRLSIKTIAKTIRTEVGKGTVFHDITKINEMISSSLPSVDFVVEYPCEWDEIVEENENRKPIIAWIWLSDNRGHGCGHSVVVFDIDRSEGVIYYNDPALGVVQEDIGKFISKWEDENVNSSLIKVRVGEKIQRKLPEYSIEIEKEEHTDERTENN